MRHKIIIVMGIIALGISASAQDVVTTNKSISLMECIRLALLQNRELQVKRFDPELAGMTLKGSYSYYDPVFAGHVNHTHKSDDGSINPLTMQPIPGYDTQIYDAKVGLTGMLPTGMRYEISSDYNNTWGSDGRLPVEAYGAGVGISVSQPLLKDFLIDAGRMAIDVNKKNLRITELGVDYQVMDVIRRVELAYIELIYAHEGIGVQEKLLEVKEKYYRDTKRKVEIGSLPPLEEKLALSQVAKIQADLIATRNGLDLAVNTLKSLIGDNFSNSVGVALAPADGMVVVPEKFDVIESWKAGFSHRPDLAQMKLDMEIADIDLKYRKNQLLPSLNVVAGYGLHGDDSLTYDPNNPNATTKARAGTAYGEIGGMNQPNDLLGVVFSVPLSRTSERYNYQASKLRKSQVGVMIKQREELIMKEIDDAVKTARTSFTRIAATREATEYAKAALDAEEKKYAAGKSTLFVVLQLQSDLASAAIAELRAKADYKRSISQLRFNEGTTLDYNKISVNMR